MPLIRIARLTVVSVIILMLLAACGAGSRPAAHSDVSVPIASSRKLTHELTQLPVRGQEAYLYALANPDTLRYIPCYCGCGSIHDSLRACFVREDSADGAVAWDPHGAGCGICQDILHDSVRMLRAGTPLAEIRDTIDATYSEFGTPTDTPRPPAS